MAHSSPRKAFDALIETGEARLMTILTFGYINTTIINDDTRKPCGVVTAWASGVITVCEVIEGDENRYKLLKMLECNSWPDKDESLKIWNDTYEEVRLEQSAK